MPRASPEVHAAYVQLDNMEADELAAISEESAVLWREQQSILAELASAQHRAKLAQVSIAWLEAAGEAAEGEAEGEAEGDAAGDAAGEGSLRLSSPPDATGAGELRAPSLRAADDPR